MPAAPTWAVNASGAGPSGLNPATGQGWGYVLRSGRRTSSQIADRGQLDRVTPAGVVSQAREIVPVDLTRLEQVEPSGAHDVDLLDARQAVEPGTRVREQVGWLVQVNAQVAPRLRTRQRRTPAVGMPER